MLMMMRVCYMLCPVPADAVRPAAAAATAGLCAWRDCHGELRPTAGTVLNGRMQQGLDGRQRDSELASRLSQYTVTVKGWLVAGQAKPDCSCRPPVHSAARARRPQSRLAPAPPPSAAAGRASRSSCAVSPRPSHHLPIPEPVGHRLLRLCPSLFRRSLPCPRRRARLPAPSRPETP